MQFKESQIKALVSSGVACWGCGLPSCCAGAHMLIVALI